MKTLITLTAALLIASFSVFGQDTTASFRQPNGVYTYVEEMPEAEFNINQYLAKAIQYPVDVRDLKKQGRVVVRFVITESGEIEDAQVMTSVFPSLDSAAVDVVRNMPKWKPGKTKGKPVPVYFTIPIKFALR